MKSHRSSQLSQQNKYLIQFNNVNPESFFLLCAKKIQEIYHCNNNRNNILVGLKNQSLKDEFNKVLWTFARKVFLPHGIDEEENLGDHPIILSDKAEFISFHIKSARFKHLVLIDLIPELPILSDTFIMFNSTSENLQNLRDFYSQMAKTHHQVQYLHSR